ncbi:unnamed protein product [Trifolium pratense]|uniref:Uncharacterized protein n=1 Tax=Trifolium pratense TaxID=57577 RepID=A0ACB0M2S7_TRIPR|nr:unnamed protein product [Trifolium pratense]
MLVIGGVSWDLNWFLQFIFSALFVAIGLHTLVKNTASRYFEVDANFEGDQHHHHPPSSPSNSMPGVPNSDGHVCAVCASRGSKQCSRCKSVRYCSTECQQSHWNSGHKEKCKNVGVLNSGQNGTTNGGFKASAAVGKSSNLIALVPSGCGTSRPIKKPKDVLFPYDEFVKLFNWDKSGFPPCGLLNCGNSCFANVVLQCLSFTRPLVAYLLENGHRKECTCNDWCFLCEFESHVQRARISPQAFSPMNILSRLPNIGGTLGYGRQEDAHEFMRFSIDTMQSVCLDEFGGEKAVPSNLQETTIIQHIFGGRLQSEVICTKCDKTSNQYESMMDLTVEIHGDAASLEECLDQFTVKEWLDGDNMYKCEGCQDYVKAWKRLTVKCAPNILTIALKRFQSGRFGKLNKRVAFPETLNLSPYMSEAGDGSDIYKLYAVVVHIDMLNASFFGHYICYIKDFRGDWYRIDDSKVACVELEEVLSQGAYMLLYRRCSARPSSLQIQTTESSGIVEQRIVEVEPSQTEQAERLSNMKALTCSGDCEVSPSDISPELKVSSSYEYESSGIVEQRTVKVEPSQTEQAEHLSNMKALTCSRDCEVSPSDISPELKVSSSYEYESSVELNSEVQKEQSEDTNMIDVESTDIANDISYSAVESSYLPISHAVEDLMDVDMGIPIEETSGCAQDQDDTGVATSCPSPGLPNDFSFLDKHSSVSVDYRNVEQDSEHIDAVERNLLTANKDAYYGNGYVTVSANKSAIPHEEADTLFSGVASFPTEKDIGNGIKKVEISADKLIM